MTLKQANCNSSTDGYGFTMIKMDLNGTGNIDFTDNKGG